MGIPTRIYQAFSSLLAGLVPAYGTHASTDVLTVGGWAAPSAGVVSSVAGRAGAVVLASTDISGLGTAATHAATDFDAAGLAAAVQTNLGATNAVVGTKVSKSGDTMTGPLTIGIPDTTAETSIATLGLASYSSLILTTNVSSGYAYPTGVHLKGKSAYGQIYDSIFIGADGSGTGLVEIRQPFSVKAVTNHNGNNINLNTGGGTGGGTLNMDGGTISNNGVTVYSGGNLNYGNGSVLADSYGDLHYGNGSILADSTGYLRYSNGSILADQYGKLHMSGSTPKYADNATAVAGGLAVGTIYSTVTGELRVVV